MTDNCDREDWIEPTIEILDVEETHQFLRRGADGGIYIDSMRS